MLVVQVRNADGKGATLQNRTDPNLKASCAAVGAWQLGRGGHVCSMTCGARRLDGFESSVPLTYRALQEKQMFMDGKVRGGGGPRRRLAGAAVHAQLYTCVPHHRVHLQPAALSFLALPTEAGGHHL